jgi:hypothetical protein
MKKALLMTVLCFSVATPLLAQTPYPTPTEYKLLQPLPLDGPNSVVEETTTLDFLPRFIKLIIGLATALAVVMVIYGGFQYILTAAPGGKGNAKETIENAIWGLLLAIGAWLILFTINPDLVKLNLNITPLPIATSTASGGGGGGGTPVAGSCSNCSTISVPHKLPPIGCKAPGPCTVNSDLNSKLVALHGLQALVVNESYPPTVPHAEACHNSGTCVDVGISSYSPQNVRRFLENASSVGLSNTIFEVASQSRKNSLIQGGVPADKIVITGNDEHFHVRLQ